ncbi:MAG: hypothetical protein ACKOAG_08265, partial [Candidatus Kapaibacterium sp.]
MSLWLQEAAVAESIADAVIHLDTSLPECSTRSGIIGLIDRSVVYIPPSESDLAPARYAPFSTAMMRSRRGPHHRTKFWARRCLS